MKVAKKGDFSRRQFVIGSSSILLLGGLPFTKTILAQSVSNGLTDLSGNIFELTIDYKMVNFSGKSKLATVINNNLPGPVLRWREGEIVTLKVTNNLLHDSSIHWHGIILPEKMDGVPGISFDGIKPGATFVYQFKVQQSGTFWYHSHSGFQEQTGMYGAIVIEPKKPRPITYNRDYVVMLSDWSDEEPDTIYSKLKKQSDYYNFRERTIGDLFDDILGQGFANTFQARAMWNNARMSARDISDVTGYTYTYLINGTTPEQGWQGLFKPGDKILLRFINSAAMTIFDVRIPGLKMTVVASDGQDIQPVAVDEFRIGVAETYDVIVEPESELAYCIFAQSIERSGYARGNLTANPSLQAAVPVMDAAPVLGHRDMAMDMDMDMSQMDHSGHDMTKMNQTAQEPEMDHSGHDMTKMNKMDSEKTIDHSEHQMSGMIDGAAVTTVGLAGYGSNNEIKHLESEFGPHVDMRADIPRSGLNDPGVGLREHQQLHGRRVLTYADLRALVPTRDRRQPSREIQLHLTGNMHRYMWSINGIKFADAPALEFKYGERLRITFINDTMMTHPMHLHGMWSELETGDPDFMPRKHTVIVQPGSKISYLVTADAKGSWAYHCHLIFHMPGMFRKVVVS